MRDSPVHLRRLLEVQGGDVKVATSPRPGLVFIAVCLHAFGPTKQVHADIVFAAGVDLLMLRGP